jgi:hypothetical protein
MDACLYPVRIKLQLHAAPVIRGRLFAHFDKCFVSLHGRRRVLGISYLMHVIALAIKMV